ncbi:MAG TPA: nickel-dependent lactate racemase [Gaiellales bacterium]|nr:nickel-dependent lactate racemase [Gaiellales bacterium]
MKVKLAYGSDGLVVDLPDERTTVVTPLHPPPAADERAAVLEALRRPVAGPPLREVVRGGGSVAISICDGTRPQPRHIVVPAILEELDGLVRLEDVVVLVATGTHRGNSDEELRAMLGDDVLAAVRVVNHDARDEGTLTWMGRFGADVPVWLNSEWAAADVRITTGFVEPHFFAGFSGGPKLVAPGLAGLETTLTLHDAARIGSPQARWGVTRGNPVHDDVRAIAAATGTHFSLDVVLDGEQRVAQAFGGELFAMHEAACAVVRQTAMRAVPRPFHVVLTTNAGFPLDQNLYQAVKGMSAAAQVVRPGGAIVCAAECRDGFPSHGSYREELTAAVSPAALLEAIAARTTTVADQWQIQIQAGIQSRSRVILHTSYLSDAELGQAHLEQTADVEGTVRQLLEDAGPDSRVCVLPYGPLTVPYVGA